MFDLPVRQRPQNLTLEIPSTDSNAIANTSGTQAGKQDDCLLLDYQNQLFILENLNRRTSRKTRKPR
ncbi:hypothetical protein LTR24_008669 [Lithohypha guttulata]|uniref:Uncharacterized protein n=1 Tax=Lithohypha guttulata TaxID=1690604 RepID=A0ABR0JZC8_9EURO|nr:hypothetical protein LTR24_008669 [Lithohypha guttulata]